MFTLKHNICGIFLLFVMMTTMFAQDYPDTFLNGETHLIESQILQTEQTLFVYLPRDYQETSISYPVHYITDAPATSNLFYSLYTILSFSGEMPPAIIVGLSSDNREYNLNPDKGAEKYLDFVEQEVVPYIASHYRTKPFRSVAGHSLGGGFALYAFLNRPGLFNLCIAGSPYPLSTLTDFSVLPEPADNSYLYCSIGGVQDIPLPEFTQFESAYTAKIQNKNNLNFSYNKQETHLSNMAVNFQNGTQWFYSDWKFVLPDSLTASADTLLREHFQNLSRKIGYPVEIGQWDVIFPVMDQLARRGDFENAKRVLRYCIELYPKSDQAHAFMARACLSTGDKVEAAKYVDRALELNPENAFALQIKSMLQK